MALMGTEVGLACDSPGLPFFPFNKWGLCFPSSNQWELHQTATASQV